MNQITLGREEEERKTILNPSEEKAKHKKQIQSTENKAGNKGKGSTAPHFFFINKQHFHPTSQIAIYHKVGPDYSN